MKKKSLTVTVVASMTSNYGEGLGNIGSVQKVFKNNKAYSIRSRESLKNAIMVQSGMYDDLEVETDGATQKLVSKDKNATNCRALEGGYMNTKGTTHIRKSSFYLTDAISTDSFVNESRFHNNVYLAMSLAKDKNLNLQNNAKECGLMPYQYEYDKSFKVYSLTIDLQSIGKDENFENEESYEEASNEEKANRVKMILDAVENLSLVVRGNLDNAEPLFVVGGLSERKTHCFENLVKVSKENIIICEELKDRVEKGYYVGLLEGDNFKNESEVKEKLNTISITKFFDKLRADVNAYFEV